MKTTTIELGFTYVDAILALVIISILLGGGLLLLGRAPQRIVERIQIEQDRVRFIHFWRFLETELSEIIPAWWSSGPIVLETDNELSILEASHPGADSLEILGDQQSLIYIISSSEGQMTFRFHTPPAWSYQEQDANTPAHILIKHPIFGEVAVSLGGQKLLSPISENSH